MTCKPLRVMVAVEDAPLAQRLTTEIRDCGHLVVGPFDDMHDAIQIAGTVQAAILDVAPQAESCFWLAQTLRHHDVPFVFLTDAALPRRFRDHPAHPRHRHAAPLLDDLHRQHQALPPEDDDGIDSVVTRMMHRSRQIMPDNSSAERLVESVLQRSVARQPDADADAGPLLLRLLDQEYRLRGRSHLH